MPIFEVQTDSGTFQIEAPDQSAALDALKSLPSAPENSLAGAGKALVSGLGEGAIALAGLPADAANLATRGIDAVAGTKTNAAVAPIAGVIGSDAIRKGIERNTGAQFYKPQTSAEKFLRTTAGFLPASIGGPAGIAQRVLTRTVAPGVASEAAGQLTEGTAFEPVARIAGALSGAAGASAATRAVARHNAPPVPTNQQIANATTAGYQGPAAQALEINAGGVNQFVDRVINNLRRDRFSERQAGQTYDLLGSLRTPEFGITHRLQDFDSVRRRLNTIAKAEGTDGEAARRVIRSIDSFTLRVPQRHVIAGDARAAGRELFEGRANAAANFRSERVQQALERARNTAVATHSGGNLENEIYKQVRTMLNNPRQHLRGWSAEEREALRAVLPGTGRNALRRVGKVAGGGGGLGQLASGGAGAAIFGWPGAFVLPAIGMTANRAGSALAERRISAVDELLRSRAPAFGAANRAARQQVLAGGILAGLPSQQHLALQGLLASRLQQPAQARE